MRSPRLVFLGPPGTGKGTQAARVATRFDLSSLSSGDALRHEIREGTELGKKVNAFVESGGLVPDELITDVILTAIRKFPSDKGFLLDGFPRTVPQAEALTRGLDTDGKPLSAAIYFRLAADQIVRRITSRRVCSNCNRTYNLLFVPPARPDVCDACGQALVQRADDTEEVVATRLETYEKLTVPLVEYYSNAGLLYDIDADAEPDAVEEKVTSVIEGLAGE